MSLSFGRCSAVNELGALSMRNEKRIDAPQTIISTCVGAWCTIVVDRDQPRRVVQGRDEKLDRHQRVCCVVDTHTSTKQRPLIRISNALHEALSSSSGLGI